MAVSDYGAVAKKNGKLLIASKDNWMQNFTDLKYETKEVYVEEKDGLGYYEDRVVVDETLVEGYNYQTKQQEMFSMIDRSQILIGDKEMMFSTYKQSFDIAIDGKLIQDLPFMYEWFEKHKKDYVVELPKVGRITVRRLDKKPRWYNIFIATFYYKGDKYEVMFGYGVDKDLNYVFSNKNYLAPSKPDKKCLEYAHKWWTGGYDDWNLSKSKQHNERRALRRMREWYKMGMMGTNSVNKY